MNAKDELFSHRVKSEAAENLTGKKRCDACLAGMILYSKELGPGLIHFQTESRTVRDLFIKLSEHICGGGTVSLSRKKRSSRPTLYSLRITDADKIKRLCAETGVNASEERSHGRLKELSEKNFGAFCAGVFLACGSVVEPSKGYHLEFVTPRENLCRELSGMFYERLALDGGTVKRRTSYVLYFKESEHIEDILTLIGAPRSSMELMNVKIYKDIRNRANRATNCDTANLEKQSRSASRQIEAIGIISSHGGIEKLPEELREIAEVRLKYPEMSLSELMNALDTPLSRSGVNHRLQRIMAIAERMKQEE